LVSIYIVPQPIPRSAFATCIRLTARGRPGTSIRATNASRLNIFLWAERKQSLTNDKNSKKSSEWWSYHLVRWVTLLTFPTSFPSFPHFPLSREKFFNFYDLNCLLCVAYWRKGGGGHKKMYNIHGDIELWYGENGRKNRAWGGGVWRGRSPPCKWKLEKRTVDFHPNC
jgi:hypothetical protein